MYTRSTRELQLIQRRISYDYYIQLQWDIETINKRMKNKLPRKKKEGRKIQVNIVWQEELLPSYQRLDALHAKTICIALR